MAIIHWKFHSYNCTTGRAKGKSESMETINKVADPASNGITPDEKLNSIELVARSLQATPRCALTGIEKRDRIELEKVISKGWETFLEVGRALATIRDRRLYRDRYGSFEEYCREKWEFSKTHANRLIGAKLQNESQARPLTGLPPKVIPEAWKRAAELAGNGSITASIVRRAAQEFKISLSGRAHLQVAHASSCCSPKLSEALKLIDEAVLDTKANDIEATLNVLSHLKEFLIQFTRRTEGSEG
jgi:hypothetical protein